MAFDIKRRKASSFIGEDWRYHSNTLDLATIVADTRSRMLQYWNADGTDYRLYQTSVRRTDDLTTRSYTKIERKKAGPDWTPTSSIMERFPEYK